MSLKLKWKTFRNSSGIHLLLTFYSSAKDVPFVERVLINTSRYVSLFSLVVDKNMPNPTINFKDDDLSSFDVIMQQRKFNMN